MQRAAPNLDLAATVREAFRCGAEGSICSELVVLDMGPPIRITDLAHDLIRLSGFEPGDIEIVYSGQRPGEKLVESLWEEGSTVQGAGTHLFAELGATPVQFDGPVTVVEGTGVTHLRYRVRRPGAAG